MIQSAGNRMHIGIFGSCNSGKSTLINAITHQEVAITSDTAGTTTDPVYKAMEIKGLGAVTLIDTAGYDDTSPLGELRVKATYKALDKTDIAVVVVNGNITEYDRAFIKEISARKIKYLVVDNSRKIVPNEGETLQKWGVNILEVNASSGGGIATLIDLLKELQGKCVLSNTVLGDRVAVGDTVVLVMPQDESAPTGRLILPQVQTIRELLDKHCVAICVQPEQYLLALSNLKAMPQLVICDSQVFEEVYQRTPKDVPLTSFSVLLAGQKGDLDIYLQGAKAIDTLNTQSRVLIAEACTHAPQTEDIGRVKIPNMLLKRYGVDKVDICAGSDYPQDLRQYDLIIHCGGCMFNKRQVMARLSRAVEQNVPITNYGITIAHLKGILDKISV